MGLVTVIEAAKFLGVSEETIKRRIRRGELNGHQQPRPQGYSWMVDIPDEILDRTTTHNNTTTTQHHHNNHNTDHNTDHNPNNGEIQRLDQMINILQEQMTLQQEELGARRREVQELHVLLQQAHAALPAPNQPHPWWRLWKK